VTAYYNEIDPFAAAWLRELIKAGHIASGEVDERSIEDVTPADLTGFTQCHWFAGIGGWSYALRCAGWPDDVPVWTGSCPCQPFSAAGKGGGFADERHLWPAFFHLISQCRPRVVFGEQVASKHGLAWLDLVQTDLEGSGYACGAVDTCAAGFGAPQIRQRLYWVACAAVGGVGTFDWESGKNVRQEKPFGRCGTPCLRFGGRPAGLYQSDPGEVISEDQTPGSIPVGGLELPGRQRWERGETSAPGHLDDGTAPQRAESEHGVSFTSAHRIYQHTPGPTNGFWRVADWLYCRDDFWRPVESGTFPLANVVPARVGRLRGYGNTIVAAQAEAFIRAFMGYRAWSAR
jgi:DNA (cytosine-5)-methyltransferase 1